MEHTPARMREDDLVDDAGRVKIFVDIRIRDLLHLVVRTDGKDGASIRSAHGATAQDTHNSADGPGIMGNNYETSKKQRAEPEAQHGR